MSYRDLIEEDSDEEYQRVQQDFVFKILLFLFLYLFLLFFIILSN